MGAKKKSPVFICLIFIFTILNSAIAFAEFSGGSGTSSDPYIIADRYDLLDLAKYLRSASTADTYRDKHYVQTAEISMTSLNTFAIGTEDYPFIGSYNGRGNTIWNISIENTDSSDPDSSYIGLFGCVESGAQIKNVVVRDATFTAYSYAGGIAAWSKGTINNCHIYSTSVTTTTSGVGGIVGNNGIGGIVSNCSSEAEVTGTGSTDSAEVGGIVGKNRGKVYNCASNGKTSGRYIVGGIVGYTYGDSLVQNCYSSGNFSGVKGQYIGSVVGEIVSTSQAVVKDCYACYTPVSGSTNYVSISQYSSDHMQTYTFLDELNNNVLSYNDSSYMWWAREDGFDYPVHTNELPYIATDQFASGSGTEDDPYILENQGHVELMCNLVNNSNDKYGASHYALGNSIAFEAGTVRFSPIGTESAPFSGTFDGRGNHISLLDIDYSSSNNIGFFGYAKNATIMRLGVIESNIKGSQRVGGIVGYANNCTVMECYNGAYVEAAKLYAGGVVGYNETGLITDCYNVATVTSLKQFGGITSYNKNGTINTCYNIGYVADTSTSAAICGTNSGGDVLDSYYNRYTSGADDKNATALSTWRMTQNAEGFMENFDFSTVWTSHKNVGEYGYYPTLTCFEGNEDALFQIETDAWYRVYYLVDASEGYMDVDEDSDEFISYTEYCIAEGIMDLPVPISLRSLYEFAYWSNYVTGEEVYYIEEGRTGDLYLLAEWSSIIPELTAPANPKWSGNIAVWDYVPNSNGYCVTLYFNNNFKVMVETTSAQYDFSDYMASNGYYRFKVYCKGDGESVADSEASQSPVYEKGISASGSRGDIDGNNLITAADAAMVLQHVLNSENLALTESQISRANVTGNTEPSASDAAAILQRALNGDYRFPIDA